MEEEEEEEGAEGELAGLVTNSALRGPPGGQHHGFVYHCQTA